MNNNEMQEDNSYISATSKEEYIEKIQVLKDYVDITDEEILDIAEHEDQHIRAAKERLANYGDEVKYEYRLKIFEYEDSVGYLPFYSITGNIKLTLEDYLYIESAPDKLSESDQKLIEILKERIKAKGQMNL